MLMASLSSLRPQFRFNPFKPTIENFAFKLHYRFTVVLLLGCVILVCAREYFGEHIRCISDQGVPEHVIKTYCFFMATFTIVRHYNESLLEAGFLPHPGVGPITQGDVTLRHTYYQWVPFVLFIQAICFYLPHSVWKKKEGGRIKALVDGLQNASLAIQDDQVVVNGAPLPTRSTLESRLESIRKDIVLRLHISRTWSTWLVAMEVGNLLNVALQVWATDRFLNGSFMGLGWRVMSYDWDHNIADPLETVFPKVTKCIFHKYGPSGSIQQHDALCVMALNIIHEKIYTLLWFWFLALFIISALAVAWRVATFFLYRRSMRFNEMMFSKERGLGKDRGRFHPYSLVSVVNGCQFADWLFLYYLAKNMQGFVFQALFSKLAEELQRREQPQETYTEKGEPELVSVAYSDETLPLKADKKSS